jgi:hypothetical protein
MIWNSGVYRVILKAWELAPRTDKGVAQFNVPIAQFIDHTFWDSQILATRRLDDSCDIKGKRGVYSLASVIKDVKKNVHLLTRRNIFAVEGLEYDLSTATKRYNALRSENRHNAIDELSGVSSNNRSPSDTVRKEVFDGLSRKMSQACEQVKIIADKFVAHSATPESRAQKEADTIELELSDLTGAHEALCRTAKFLFWCILNRGLFVSPWGTAHPLALAYLDRPLVMPEYMAQLQSEWDECFKQPEAWEPWPVSEVLAVGSSGQPQSQCRNAD